MECLCTQIAAEVIMVNKANTATIRSFKKHMAVFTGKNSFLLCTATNAKHGAGLAGHPVLLLSKTENKTKENPSSRSISV